MELTTTEQARSLLPPASFDELVETARSRAEQYQDYEDIRLGSTLIHTDGTWKYNGVPARLSRRALSQLCARLELPNGGSPPAGYLARCPGDLAAQHLNHWLQAGKNPDRKVLVRTVAGDDDWLPIVRAVLSDRYAMVDSLPLLETLRQMVPGYRLGVQAWSLDDELLTLRLVRDEDHPASLADPLRVGLHVSNSEIGVGRISIAAYITRLVCTNGLVVTVAELGGIHRRHIGRAGEDLAQVVYQGLTEVLRDADEAAWRFDALRRKDAPHPVEDFVGKTAREAALPENMVPQTVAMLRGETLFDVVNAFTQVAQRLPVAERVRIESYVSRFLREGRNDS